jgi:hypothetical protein
MEWEADYLVAIARPASHQLGLGSWENVFITSMQLIESLCFVSNLGNEAPASVLQPTVGVGKLSVWWSATRDIQSHAEMLLSSITPSHVTDIVSPTELNPEVFLSPHWGLRWKFCRFQMHAEDWMHTAESHNSESVRSHHNRAFSSQMNSSR